MRISNYEDVLAKALAYDFVYGYLESEPDRMDVSEFVWDNAEGVLEDKEVGILVEKVFQEVIIQLSEVRDKF